MEIMEVNDLIRISQFSIWIYVTTFNNFKPESHTYYNNSDNPLQVEVLVLRFVQKREFEIIQIIWDVSN